MITTLRYVCKLDEKHWEGSTLIQFRWSGLYALRMTCQFPEIPRINFPLNFDFEILADAGTLHSLTMASVLMY